MWRSEMMSSALLFALGSLICAGLNDVVFKRFSTRSRSRGLYLAGIGMVWTILQLTLSSIQGQVFDWSTPSLVFGLICGLLLAASNILLLESLTHIDVGLGSMIYRLNTVVVVILSVAFLAEALDFFKASGVLAGLAAVLLLYRRSGHAGDLYTNFRFFFGLAVVASVLRALYAVVSKFALLHGAAKDTMLLITAVSWIVGGLLYALIRYLTAPSFRDRQPLDRTLLFYALFSGVLVFLIVNLLLQAVELGEASVVVPVANLSFVFALLLSVALKWEQLTWRKGIAVVTSLVSLYLLSVSGG